MTNRGEGHRLRTSLYLTSKVGLSGLRTIKQLIVWAKGCDAKRGDVLTHAGRFLSKRRLCQVRFLPETVGKSLF